MITKIKSFLAATVFISFNAFCAPNSIIAIVNDDIVTYSAVAEALSKTDKKSEKIKHIDNQISRLLQLQKIKELEIKPKLKALNNALSNVASQNSLTLAQLQSLKQYDAIVAQITEQLALSSLKRFVLDNANLVLTQKEIDEAVLAQSPMQRQLQAQVKIAQIAISSIDTTDNPTESKDSLIQKLLYRLTDQIKQGQSFSDLAKLHSQDPSYKNGGESGWLIVEKLPDVFKKQIEQLKPAELSTPFKAGGGWWLIKVLDRREIDLSLEQTKAKLISKKKDQYYNNWVQKLKDKAYIEIFDHKL